MKDREHRIDTGSPEEMKRCHFCGASAHKFAVQGKWKVECSRLDEGCGVETCFWDTEADAVAAWNREGE